MTAVPRDPAEVVREHAAFVRRVLRHLGVPSELLDDASQEVFLAVCRQLNRFEGRSSVRTWIYGICRYVALRADRPRGREVLSGELPEVDQPASQDSALWLKQASAQLRAALATLEETPRMVFLLYEVEGMTMEEVAAAVGAPVTTCYSRLYAARERVQNALRRNANVRVGKPVEVQS